MTALDLCGIVPLLHHPAMPTDVHQVHLRLPADLHAAALKAAKADDRSFSYVTRQALEEFLQARGYLRTDA